MSRYHNPLTQDIRAPFSKGAGLTSAVSKDGQWDNNYALRGRNAADTADIELVRVSADDDQFISGAFALPPMRIPCLFRAVLNAAVATTTFHVFNYPGRVVKITEVHTTAGTGTSFVANVTKDADGVAAGAGTSLMSGTFNLKGTADTELTATLSTSTDANGVSVLEFVAGDSLAFVATGTATTSAGVFLEVWVQPYLRAVDFSFYSKAVTSQDQCFMIFNRPYGVRAMRWRHSTAEATAATSWIQVTQDTTTNAPGAGTDLLTNNTNNGFDGKAAANTVQLGAFTAVTPPTGDRLAVDFSASNTELAGVCVTVTIFPQANRLEVPYWLYVGSVVDTYVFSADRDYRFSDGRFVQAVAAGGASTANIEKTLSGVVAAGAGTAILATAWDLNATANTVVIASPIVVPTVAGAESILLMVAGEKLSIDYANTAQSTAGVCFTLSLLAR